MVFLEHRPRVYYSLTTATLEFHVFFFLTKCNMYIFNSNVIGASPLRLAPITLELHVFFCLTECAGVPLTLDGVPRTQTWRDNAQ